MSSDKTKANDRGRFEAELTEVKSELTEKTAPQGAGAEAFPALSGVWSLILQKLSDPAFVTWLWQGWQQMHGGGGNPTPAPAPPPPPEPSS